MFSTPLCHMSPSLPPPPPPPPPLLPGVPWGVKRLEREIREEMVETGELTRVPSADGVADGGAGDGVNSDGVNSDGVNSDGVNSDGVNSDKINCYGAHEDGLVAPLVQLGVASLCASSLCVHALAATHKHTTSSPGGGGAGGGVNPPLIRRIRERCYLVRLAFHCEQRLAAAGRGGLGIVRGLSTGGIGDAVDGARRELGLLREAILGHSRLPLRLCVSALRAILEGGGGDGGGIERGGGGV